MKPADVFGLIVRVFGLFVISLGLWYFVAGVETVLETVAHAEAGPEGSGYSVISYLGTGLLGSAVGAICLFCADSIVKLSYREK